MKNIMPPGVYWTDYVLSLPAWKEWLGIGDVTKELGERLRNRFPGARVVWSYQPPGLLSSVYGDNGVFFATLQTSSPVEWTEEDVAAFKMFWTPWRGPGVPGPNDVIGFPKVTSWQQGLTEYAQDIVDIPKKAASGALIGLAVVGGIGLGLYLLTRRKG